MTHKAEQITEDISIREFYALIEEWLTFLRSQSLKILIVGFLGGLFGFSYAWVQKETYTAKTTFVVEESKSGASAFGGLANLAGQFGVDVGGAGSGGVFSGDNILLYFKSPSLSREVLLTKFDSTSNKSLADIYCSAYKLNENWKKDKKIGEIYFPPISSKITYTRLQDSLLQQIIAVILKNQFNVSKTEKKAGFIDVSATMIDEVLAKAYCERIVENAVNRYISIKTQRQKSAIQKLQSRVDSIANLLQRKTLSGATLINNSSTMDINPLYTTENSVAVESTLRDKALLATIFASVTQNLEMAKFSLSQETPVIQIIDTPAYPLIKNKISKLKTAVTYAFLFSFLAIFYFVIKEIKKKYNNKITDLT